MKIIYIVLISLILFGCSEKEGNVVYTKEDGTKTKDITELEDGTVQFKTVSEKGIPDDARKLHEQARSLGQAGKYDESIQLLVEAIEIAPTWPYPVYDMAFTYMLKKDYAKAYSYYKKVDELAPQGFFTVKTAVWCLAREESGEFPVGSYMKYLALEWHSPEDKEKAIELLAEELPGFLPVLKEQAIIIKSPDKKIERIDELSKMSPDPETYGILMVNKALALNERGNKQEALKLLNSLILSDSVSAGTKQTSREVLKYLNK